jgi:hypothetical protein
MAYAEGFVFDVFLSYESEDNESLRPSKKEGWVSRFVTHLKSALSLELGEQIKLGPFDRLPVEHLRGYVRSSAVFVPLLSSAYFGKGWAELSAFTANAWATNRIAPVEILPIREKNYPPVIKESELVRFWVSEKGRVRRRTYEDDPEEYTINLARLTKRVAGMLRGVRADSVRPKESPATPSLPKQLDGDLDALRAIMNEVEKEFLKKDDGNKNGDSTEASGD